MSKGIRNFVIFALAMIGSWIVGSSVPPTWTVEQITLDVLTDDNGKLYYIYREKPAYFDAVPLEQAQLNPSIIHGSNAEPPIKEEFVSEMRDGETPVFQTPRKTPLGLLVSAARRGCRDVVLAHPRTRYRSFGRYCFGRAYFDAI